MSGCNRRGDRRLARDVFVAAAVLSTGGCDGGTAPAPETFAASPAAPPAAAAPAVPAVPAVPAPAFTDRVWVRAGQSSAPGAILVFLRDGTLISDSCFETYRLSSWRAEGELLVWSEDGIDIRAQVASADTHTLVLRVMLRGGEEEQRFVAATVPYVCPDMTR